MNMQALRKLTTIGVAMLIVAGFAGCGGSDENSSQNLVEASKAKIKDLDTQYNEIYAKYEAASDAYDATAKKAQKLRSQALSLIYAGDVQRGNALESQAEQLDSEGAPNHAEMNRLMDELHHVSSQQSAAQAGLDAQLGCDKSCRAKRNLSNRLVARCMIRMSGDGELTRKIIHYCRQQFPVPKLPGEAIK